MDREKLVKIVLESEEDLDLEDVRRLNNRDTPDSLFLTELNTIAGDLDWRVGSEASRCFSENEIIRSPEEDYVGSYWDATRDVVRFINYRGELEGYEIKARDKVIEFRASDVIIPKDFDEYKPTIKFCGSKVVVKKAGAFSEWQIDSNSNVEIVNEKECWSAFDNIVINLVGNNSEVMFRSEALLPATNLNINLILYGENNKVVIDMDNFGVKSEVKVMRMSFAKNNEITVRHMIPEFVEIEENFTDNNNIIKVETLYDD
jgi:hypothetical protein